MATVPGTSNPTLDRVREKSQAPRTTVTMSRPPPGTLRCCRNNMSSRPTSSAAANDRCTKMYRTDQIGRCPSSRPTPLKRAELPKQGREGEAKAPFFAGAVSDCGPTSPAAKASVLSFVYAIDCLFKRLVNFPVHCDILRNPDSCLRGIFPVWQ
jgi:hypothetical protein